MWDQIVETELDLPGDLPDWSETGGVTEMVFETGCCFFEVAVCGFEKD